MTERFEKYIDLHMHTTASDGVTGPADLLEIVRKSGVSAFAVTDHDTFEGAFEIRKMMNKNDPELITGVELSAGIPGEDLHLLVYLIDWKHLGDGSDLMNAINDFQHKRNTRGQRMVETLNDLGLKIDFSEVEKIANGSPIGRPHIADAMLKSGVVKTYEEAFWRWIGYKKPAYVEKECIHPREAIELAHKASGLVFLAHPGVNDAEEALERLSKDGLDGVEIYHPSSDQTLRKRLKKAAQKYGLLISGGSDYHGRDDNHGRVGEEKVPYELLEKMKERAASCN